jgi:hypothetical protein
MRARSASILARDALDAPVDVSKPMKMVCRCAT